MTLLSQNGFPVLDAPPNPALSRFEKGGSPFIVATSILHAAYDLADFFDSCVEPIAETGWDGGFSRRLIRGSTSVWSNHASGTAVDFNASQHPRNGAQYAGFTPAQVRAIRWYLRSKRGKVWHWGADFKSTPDPMHFEIVSLSYWKSAENPWKH